MIGFSLSRRTRETQTPFDGGDRRKWSNPARLKARIAFDWNFKPETLDSSEGRYGICCGHAGRGRAHGGCPFFGSKPSASLAKTHTNPTVIPQAAWHLAMASLNTSQILNNPKSFAHPNMRPDSMQRNCSGCRRSKTNPTESFATTEKVEGERKWAEENRDSLPAAADSLEAGYRGMDWVTVSLEEAKYGIATEVRSSSARKSAPGSLGAEHPTTLPPSHGRTFQLVCGLSSPKSLFHPTEDSLG